MSGRTWSVVAGLALIVAQICCAPPMQAAPSPQCPMKAQGSCPMRRNTCSATAPQRSTAVTPKPIVVIPALRHWSAGITPVLQVHEVVSATLAIHPTPILVLRI